MSFYETDEQVGQYMEFHYGDTWLGVPNYPRACAAHCLQVVPESRRERALDLGCAVGRTTFELAQGFAEVAGVDLSRRFIDQARILCRAGEQDYFRVDEGELGQHCKADLSALGLSETREKVRFEQGDACDLGPGHRDYDLVFAGNLIDRLPDPGQFLKQVHRHLRPGGMLVISSPYTLLDDFTPRPKWIGGFSVGERDVSVLEGMGACLEPWFEPAGEPLDLPFVIRETRRKFQHSFAEISAWRRL